LLRVVGAIELDRFVFKSAAVAESRDSTGRDHQNHDGIEY
jgi:hypothetical protein